MASCPRNRPADQLRSAEFFSSFSSFLDVLHVMNIKTVDVFAQFAPKRGVLTYRLPHKNAIYAVLRGGFF